MTFVNGGVSSLKNSAYFLFFFIIHQTLIEGHLCATSWDVAESTMDIMEFTEKLICISS